MGRNTSGASRSFSIKSTPGPQPAGPAPNCLTGKVFGRVKG